MLPKIALTQTEAWKQLHDHYNEMKSVQIKDLFQQDPERFQKLSFQTDNILIDFSKNRISSNTLALLLQLAHECKLEDAIKSMFEGEAINETENRQVLHVALRNRPDKPIYANGADVMPEVEKVLQQMDRFCSSVHTGEWKGYTGKKIRYIVNWARRVPVRIVTP